MEKREIYIPVNCDNCVHARTCKFLERYNEMANSNFMFGMFEYLEWNNLEMIFKSNAGKCKHYQSVFIDGKISMDKKGAHVSNLLHVAFNGQWDSWRSGDKRGTLEIVLKDGTNVNEDWVENNLTVTHKKPADQS